MMCREMSTTSVGMGQASKGMKQLNVAGMDREGDTEGPDAAEQDREEDGGAESSRTELNRAEQISDDGQTNKGQNMTTSGGDREGPFCDWPAGWL